MYFISFPTFTYFFYIFVTPLLPLFPMSVKLRLKKYKSGTVSYYLDVYQSGNRHTEFIDVSFSAKDSKLIREEKKTLAENIRAKRQLEIESGSHGFIPKHKKQASFNDFYINFLNQYKRNDYRMFKYAYEKFQDFTKLKRVAAHQINQKLIEGFKDHLLFEAGLSGETPHDYFRRFKHVIKKAYQEGLITNIEFEKISRISIKRNSNQNLKKQILTESELTTLKNTYCGNEQVKNAFLFACFTGLGVAEIRHITWNEIQNDKLILDRKKTGTPIVNDLPESAKDILSKYERGIGNNKIFTLPSDPAISKDLKNWVKKAEIDKSISFYCGRHTFAVLLLNNGANLKTVADCLGHTTTAHTIKYLNYVDALKEEALRSLPSI